MVGLNGDDTILRSDRSTARFLVIDSGVAASMPTVDGVTLRADRPLPCSASVIAGDTCDLRIGMIYVDPVTQLRLLCIQSGSGVLACEGRRLLAQPGARRQVLRKPATE